jgi:hypothetical protein
VQKLNYIHQNLVKRGYVDQAEYWRYSSARNYAGETGLFDVFIWVGRAIMRGLTLERLLLYSHGDRTVGTSFQTSRYGSRLDSS